MLTYALNCATELHYFIGVTCSADSVVNYRMIELCCLSYVAVAYTPQVLCRAQTTAGQLLALLVLKPVSALLGLQMPIVLFAMFKPLSTQQATTSTSLGASWSRAS
jgi:hypothetical protein